MVINPSQRIAHMDKNLNYDDYCRIVGKLVLEATTRQEGLEGRLAAMAAAFKAETERLRKLLPAPDSP